MSDRKLVTIRTVSKIIPIEGADNIELAQVDGWQCVVKKGEFKEGDSGVYFEIDSFVPLSDERFSFLANRSSTLRGIQGSRVRTIKLRGQLSQGLLLPISMFPEITTWVRDLDSLLGVTKWESPEEIQVGRGVQHLTWLGKKVKKLQHTKLNPLILWFKRKFPYWFSVSGTGVFPSFIPKTDEERIQNVLNKFAGDTDDYEATIKLDGSSMTVWYNQGKFGVCSRNLNLMYDKDNKYWATAQKYLLPKSLKNLGLNIAIQGELMGPGIQGNRENLGSYEFYVYKIWDINTQRYYNKANREAVCHGLGLSTVPSLGVVKLYQFPTIDNYLAFAKGKSLVNPMREGVVFCNVDGQKSFKVISNEYLLKEKA